MSSRSQELTWEYSVQVSATVSSSPPAISFSWPQDVAALPEFYAVSRKSPADEAWGPATPLPGTTTQYTDTNVVLGVGYEYQFYKSTSNHVGYGYISSGIELPMIEQRAKLILLIEQTIAPDLHDELARLQQDLVGDGWVVLRHDVPRTASVPEVKALIDTDYRADPAKVKALFLLGRIPVPYSGDTAPDGHPVEHSGAWPADAFYGVMDGLWTDYSVTDVSSQNPRNHNLPRDGKYDQSELPGVVRLEIGRVDFADMRGVDTNGIATFPPERELVRRYLNKDHNYRHKRWSLPGRGLVYNYTGDRGGEAFAADAWRNYAPLLGPPPAVPLNANQFLPLLHTNGYQWSYATAGSGPSMMWNLGGTYWIPYATSSGSSLDFVRTDPQTSFVMLLGSWIGDWDMPDNLMRSVLATPTYGLACVYAGRPHWYFHALGMGATLGYCARLTQNNHAEGLYRNQSNNFAGFVHTALLGDPTLRLYPVAPPSALQSFAQTNGTFLSWSNSIEAVSGYYVYRAQSPSGPFDRLTPGLLETNGFLDTSNLSQNCSYMVRAVRLETTPSGSYYNASQGIFVSASNHPAVRLLGSGTNLNLTWSTVPGHAYRILWAAAVTNSEWVPLSNDLLATGWVITCSNIVSGIVSGSGWAFTNSSRSVWVEDALPSDAIPGPDSDTWNWVSTAPRPLSGQFAWQSTLEPGLHQQYFNSAGAPLMVNTGDVFVVSVFLDAEHPPREIMLQWNDGFSWEHRAFWGANLITYGVNGSAARIYQGDLPAAGTWQTLRVGARDVGLEGAGLKGMAFSAYDGEVTWDAAGKESAPVLNQAPDAILPQGFFKVLRVQ